MSVAADDWQTHLRAASDSIQVDLERVWPPESHEWDVAPYRTSKLREWRAEAGLLVSCFEPVGPFMRLEEVVAVRPLHRRQWIVVADVADAAARIRARWSELTGMPWPS